MTEAHGETPKALTVWMYYETDGDSGYYGIKLFATKQKADAYATQKGDAYRNVASIKVEP
jgi:hypothetical protein